MSARAERDIDSAFSGPQMLTISQAAARSQKPVHALRHYEDLGLLSPLRDRRGAGFYSQELACTAARIAEMRRLGVPLPQISAALQGLSRGLNEVLAGRLDALEDEKRILIALLKTFWDRNADGRAIR